jgi:hypothetical protein
MLVFEYTAFEGDHDVIEKTFLREKGIFLLSSTAPLRSSLPVEYELSWITNGGLYVFEYTAFEGD